VYDQLPCVYPLEIFPEISSIPDLGENEWEMRLYSEIDTLRLRNGESEPAAQPLPALPAKCPPWNRMRPVVQRAFRADGQRVRDGGGMSSPLLVDPATVRADGWPDVLSKVRDVLKWASVKFKVPECIHSCSDVCSRLMRNVEQKLDVAGLEIQHTEMQNVLKDHVSSAASCAFEKLNSLASVLFPGGGVPDFSIAPGQPFRLRWLALMAKLCQDEDWQLPLQCERGVPLIELSDCPHYPCKSDSADVDADLVTWSSNYKSANEVPEIVRELLSEDLDTANEFAQGPFTWAELLQELGLPAATPEPAPDCSHAQLVGGIAVMRLGCINECQYDEHGTCTVRKYRLVCDGTASGVNKRVLLPCVMETPGLLDGEAMFSVSAGETLVGMKVDVRSAFKRIKLLPSEYKFAVFFFDGAWYLYIVLPFGMRASAFWWVRLYSIVHRVLKRLLQTYFHGSAMYIDDSLYSACKSQFPEVFAIILLFLTILGVPLSWKKLFIGDLLDWVGFRIDFIAQRVFLSSARLLKLRCQMESLILSPRVHVSDFRKLVFRMVWASQCFPPAKCFLHGFFAVLKSQVAATGFVYRVKHLEEVFLLWEQLIEAAAVWDSDVVRPRVRCPGALTRTDAMASDAGIYVAGWHARSALDLQNGNFHWFAFQLDINVFPEVKSAPNRVISAAEAVAAAMAVAAFGSVMIESDSMVTVLGSGRWYSPSPNLAFAMSLLVKAGCHWKFKPVIHHVSGKDNALADALSRMHCDPEAKKAIASVMKCAGSCPAALRVPAEVFYKVLPELEGFLTPC